MPPTVPDETHEQTHLSRFTDESAATPPETTPEAALDALDNEAEIHLAAAHDELAALEELLFGEVSCPDDAWDSLEPLTRHALLYIRTEQVREEVADRLGDEQPADQHIRGFE